MNSEGVTAPADGAPMGGEHRQKPTPSSPNHLGMPPAPAYTLAGNHLTPLEYHGILLQQIKEMLIQETRKATEGAGEFKGDRLSFGGLGVVPELGQSLMGSNPAPPTNSSHHQGGLLAPQPILPQQHARLLTTSASTSSPLSVAPPSQQDRSRHGNRGGGPESEVGVGLAHSVEPTSLLSELPPIASLFGGSAGGNEALARGDLHKEQPLMPPDHSEGPVSSSNRLLTKLIQNNCPSDTSNSIPPPALRLSEFSKIPNASLRPNLPPPGPGKGGLSPLHGTAYGGSVATLLSSMSSPMLPRTATPISSSQGGPGPPLRNPGRDQGPSHFGSHFSQRLEDPILGSKATTAAIKGGTGPDPVAKSGEERFDFQGEDPTEALLMGATAPLLSEGSIGGLIPTLSLAGPDQGTSKDGSCSRPGTGPPAAQAVDLFLSELHDPDLLPPSLSSSIVPDIAPGGAGGPQGDGCRSPPPPHHLPELPPSPIMGGDFLEGSSAAAPTKSSSTSFLPGLSSSATEHLALSFSTHFLENSNLSIDMTFSSEGDVSLPVLPHSSDFETSHSKKGSGGGGGLPPVEEERLLTFTHALKSVAERDKEGGPTSSATISSPPHAGASSGGLLFGASPSPRKDALVNLVPGDIFKAPPRQVKGPPAPPSSGDESSSSSSSTASSTPSPSFAGGITAPPQGRGTYSAKEIHLVSIDGSSQASPQDSPVKGEALVQQVSCFKCQLCSYLSLERSDMLAHMEARHAEGLARSPEGNKGEEELPMQQRKKKKAEPRRGPAGTKRGPPATGAGRRKKAKEERAPTPTPPQCKVEIWPREKGGCFQKRIVMVDGDKSPKGEGTPCPGGAKVKAECDMEALLNIKTDISVEDVPLPSGLPPPPQQDPAGEGPANAPSHAQETTKKGPGRPSASQTLGIIKFRKRYPKVAIPQETLGIRCGVNGCGLRLRLQDNIAYHRRCHVDAFLRCPECHVKFTHWASLAMHLWRAHMVDMELHKCDKCNFKAYSYTKLMNGHWKTHSTERPFLCDVCGKDFKTAKQLRSHKVLHVEKTEELKHHCDMCQRRFAEKRMLLLHLEAVHKKVKPYLCNYCGKNFASKSTLNLHIRKHTGEKPFACESCNYRTSDHNSMRRHKMKHTNDRPYVCPYCDYSSIQSSTFKVHLRRKHEVQAQKDGVIFSCSLCTFKTVKRDNFLAHVGTHHKITDEEQNKGADRQWQELNQQHPIKKHVHKTALIQNPQQQRLLREPHLAQSPSLTKSTVENSDIQVQESQQLFFHPGKEGRVPNSGSLRQQQGKQQNQEAILMGSSSGQQQQQLVIAKNQMANGLGAGAEEDGDGGVHNSTTTAFLVTNPAIGGAKSEANLDSGNQQPLFYLFSEVNVNMPHVVNIDVNEGAEAGDVTPDVLGSVLLPGNLPASLSGPVIMTADGALLQPTNDGVVQLTPEVVAMPVGGDLQGSLPSQGATVLPNGLIYLATSSEDGSVMQNSSLFS